jgi:hypothetical protein
MNQRILTSIGVATVVAGLAVPGAFAMRNGQDGGGSTVASHVSPIPYLSHGVGVNAAQFGGTGVVIDGRNPDTKDAASAAQQALRSVQSSTVQIGPVRVPSTWVNVQPSQSLPDGRSPDTKDAAAAARQLAQQSTGDAVSRYLRNTSSPTIPYLSHGIGVDPAQFGGTGVTPALQSSSGGSFSWGDAGIGAGGAFALFLLMTAAAAVSQRNRKHVATS